jgi:hypothetical protein
MNAFIKLAIGAVIGLVGTTAILKLRTQKRRAAIKARTVTRFHLDPSSADQIKAAKAAWLREGAIITAKADRAAERAPKEPTQVPEVSVGNIEGA